MVGFNNDNDYNNRKRKKQAGITPMQYAQKQGGDSATQHYSQAKAQSFNNLKQTLFPQAPQMQWKDVNNLGYVNDIVRNLVSMKNQRIQQDYDRQRQATAMQFISRLSTDIQNQAKLKQQQQQDNIANLFKQVALENDRESNINKLRINADNNANARFKTMENFDSIISSINPKYDNLEDEQKQDIRRRFLETGAHDFQINKTRDGWFSDDYNVAYGDTNQSNTLQAPVVPARPASVAQPQAPEQIPEVNIDGDLSEEVLDNIARKYTELGIKRVKINGNTYRID